MTPPKQWAPIVFVTQLSEAQVNHPLMSLKLMAGGGRGAAFFSAM